MKHEFILVLDFGSQYNQLITRRVRELGVYSELHDNEISIEEIKKMNPKGIILSGGPNSVYEENSLTIDDEIFNLGIPVLGICYGMQLMQHKLGGKVESATSREYGAHNVDVTPGAKLFEGTPETQQVLMSHSDKVVELAEGFKVVATSDNCPIAAAENVEKDFYCFQFHPEVRHSEFGYDLIKNFIRNVCKCTENWTIQNFIDEKIEEIRAEVGDQKVLCALSGGVDSSVVAALLDKAIGLTNKEERTALYKQAQVIVHNQAPWIPVAHSVGFAPLSPRVKGYVQSPFGYDSFYGVSVDNK